MNEAETRAELIDPKLKACGWGVVEGSKILREYNITDGKIQTGGGRSKKIIADYVLVYKGIKLAVVEAKSDDLGVGEGVAQAKQYADKLKLETTYSTNGKEIYSICMKTGAEGLVENYLTPEELWNKTYPIGEPSQALTVYKPINEWRLKFAEVPFEDKSGTWQLRYYQEIAVRNTIEAIANGKERILLTLATGTGKTAIAFQIAWKLFQTRWNLKRDGSRRPRILFLADRNILADQAYNSFSAFPEDALVRIKPNEIKKSGKVPTNGSIFFTIFQSFMTASTKGVKSDSAEEPPIAIAAEPDVTYKTKDYNFGQYPKDYFDFIIIDECHRGGANDEGNWRGILEYFSPAVQLGLTATPKRKDNIDTYKYFGEPVYVYSLKEGINDGFLTPFKVKRIKTTLDDYIYTSDDQIIEGEIEEGKTYKEGDFNRIIEIKAREAKRVQIYMDEANQKEKAIIFCATQDHAAAVRDLVNQYKVSTNPNYCARVTANDGAIGEQFLREFQDNEKTIPTILTTSQKLSTGVDARNIRNIVLMRPVNSMIEFKQIVGRGTRLFDGKEFFTIYDYVDAYHHFADPEWDGEPLEPETDGEPRPPKQPCKVCGQSICVCEKAPKEPCQICGEFNCSCNKRQKIKIKLRDGKEREIQSMIATSFWSADGKPISAEEFLNNLFGALPNLFKSEEELRTLWSNPMTRKVLLDKLEEVGFPKSDLLIVQQLVNMEKSDLFDVLEYVFNGNYNSLTREQRVAASQATIFAILNDKQKEFIEFVLSKYVETGVEELDQEKLPILLTNKYQSLEDAKEVLGNVGDISKLFIEFQKYLYEERVA
jgi:type I restriction enzyme R subunit